MIEVKIDEAEVRKITFSKVEEHLKKIDQDLIFWDRKELERRTCMSWPTIQKEFFFLPNFPKHKVGAKWYFPADATREFLVEWLFEQS